MKIERLCRRITNIIVAIAICGMAIYVNGKHYHRFDCIASDMFSLTGKTKNILKGLQKPIIVSTLFNREDRFTKEIFEQVSDILAEYADQSDKLSIDHIDPVSERTKVELIAKRINIEQIALNSVIFECEERSKHVDIKELIERKFPFNFKGEEVFTAAIIAVSQEKQTGIFFTTGHGERSIEDFNLIGLSSIANALKRDNYGTVSLDILSEKKIPDSCSILVIAGPTKGFSTEEVNIIRNYLENDGKLLVMLEPALGRNKPSELKGLLKDYNVEIKEDAVIYNNVAMPLFGAQTVAEVHVSKDKYQEHKITKDLANLTTVFFGAIPIGIVKTQDIKQGFNVFKLAQAPDLSWGETQVESGKKPENDKDVDVQSPLNLAVVVEPVNPETAVSIAHGAPAPEPGTEQTKGSRLVVFGDTDFATNEYTGNYPGNLDIFLNSITWLAQKETQLGILARPQNFRQMKVKMKVKNRWDEFVKKNAVEERPSFKTLSINPFVYEGKIVTIVAIFREMLSATQGVFEAEDDRGNFVVVSDIPKGLFTSEKSVVLAGRVLGKTKLEIQLLGTVNVPHLKFVGVHFCKDRNCSDIIPSEE